MTPIDGLVKVLGVPATITTTIALAALSVVTAYLLGSQWLKGKNGAVKLAIEQRDDAALARVLGGVSVPLESLSPEQKFTLAESELKSRARLRMVAYGLSFFAFLALLAFAFGLAARKQNEQAAPTAGPKLASIDVLDALDLLRLMPPERRAEGCRKLLSQEDCARAAPMILSLEFRAPTQSQGEILKTALARGGVTKAELRELAACGGNFAFKIVDYRLQCADGTEIPTLSPAPDAQALTNPEAIVFHGTGTSDASFASVANLMAMGMPDRSPALKGPLAHLLISRNGAVAQTAPFDRKAYHVGVSEPWRGRRINNGNAIGVELISTATNQTYTAAQIDAAEGVAKALVAAYGIQTIVGHQDVAPNRKRDPGPAFPMQQIRTAAGLPADG